MSGETELTTVYRSADANAKTDASAVHDVLMKEGLNPVLLGDRSPGVVQGTWEVRVPPAEVATAEQIVSTMDQEEPGAPDPSHELDVVTIATTDGTMSEIEATSIQGILDANGIPCVVVGTSTLPNLGFHIKVARDEVDRARQAIEEARAAGPAGAAEAQAASESPDQKGA